MVVKKKPETVGSEALTMDEESAILLDAVRGRPVEHEETHSPETSAKPARIPYQSVFADSFDNLDEKEIEAEKRIAEAEEIIAAARIDVRIAQALKKVKEGLIPGSFSPADHEEMPVSRRKAPAAPRAASSAPRAKAGTIQARILEAMGADPMPVKEILERTMSKGTEDEPKFRSALAAMKRKGELGYDENNKTYTKP